MRIGPFMVDTESMTTEMVDSWIKELKRVRGRKSEADSFIRSFNALIETMRQEGFDFICRDTGEVLDPKYWVMYDNLEHYTMESKEYKTDVD